LLLGDAVDAAAARCDRADVDLHDLAVGECRSDDVARCVVPGNSVARHHDAAVCAAALAARNVEVGVRAAEESACSLDCGGFEGQDFECTALRVLGQLECLSVALVHLMKGALAARVRFEENDAWTSKTRDAVDVAVGDVLGDVVSIAR
jgi:hypothetical protein